MKNIALLLILLASTAQLPAQTITTVAGNGSEGYSGDGGPATSASLYYMWGVAVDGSGNIYIADAGNNRIRKVDAGTGTIATVAGNGTVGYSGDGGPATSAGLYFAVGVAVDGAGNIYIADAYNNRIRKVDAGTGTITTVAGNGTLGYSGDGGPATSASLYYVWGVAVDGSGNIYIADAYNNRIRKVDAGTQTITTVAGNGSSGYSGDGGPATSAALNRPEGVAVDASGNIYIADRVNGCIRKVDAASGTITTVAGNGGVGYSGDGGPATSATLYYPPGVALDGSGNIYIADSSNGRIRQVDARNGIITTVAGNGSAGYSGDGGPATSAGLYFPLGVAVDGTGNIYIADTYNQRIRKVSGLIPPTVTPTTTSVSPSVNPTDLGDPVTFTATVTSFGSTPTGSVTLLDGSTALATLSLSSGQATFTTSSLAAGSHNITAYYTPDVSIFASSSGPLRESVISLTDLATLNGNNTFTGNQTIAGTLTATSLIGSGSALTGVTASGLNCSGCIANTQLGVTYAVGDSKGGNALNALMLGGLLPSAFAPAKGSTVYVVKAGDTMTGNLSLPNLTASGKVSANGSLVVGSGGTAVTKHLSILVNPAFAALKPGGCTTATFTFTGASDGDTVALGVPNSRMTGGGNLVYTAWVAAADTLTLQACNANVNIPQKTAGSGSIRVDLWKH